MRNLLLDMLEKRNDGINTAYPSFCSANKFVIEAILRQGKRFEDAVIIESTSNQVNQFGGYLGMTPSEFKDYVYEIADRVGFDRRKIILGGDHLGPQPWQDLAEKEAMENSVELVRQCVLAGYTKIHLDTSMRVGDDDPDEKLETRTIAQRGAVMLAAAENAYEELLKEIPEAIHPVYVIGSEVPIPGGAQDPEAKMQITSPEDFRETVETYEQVFRERGLSEKWQHVVAVVVQPGVEFGDEEVAFYDRGEAVLLVRELENYPNLVFEGHSTDYQTPKKLAQMAEDGIAILKVGPALTFALREALFAYSWIEKELIEDESKRSNFMEVLDRVMRENPADWQKYYHGTEDEKRIARKYSFSDRCRYYMSRPEVVQAIDQLIRNVSEVRIPLSMIRQFFPIQYVSIRAGRLKNEPLPVIFDRITEVIETYNYATKPNYLKPGMLMM